MQLSEVKQALDTLIARLLTVAQHDRERVEAEFGEVLHYLLRTGDRLGINLAAERPPRILILEDERIVAVDLQETLNALGYDAYAIAANGPEALAMAREKCPDIVLTDIRIAGEADGIEVAAQMRKEFNAAVIFVSALADDATLQRARQSKPSAYLVKPVSGLALKTTIDLTARQRRQSRSTVG
jgi:CheY-like chemotaxis protein